jgi:broad specificity phosphatase PhoE
MRHDHQIWLIRHGETEWSQSGKHTGRTDVPLSETGKRRAQALRPLLSSESFALVLTSPLARARETCRIAGFGDLCHVDGDLAEWDYGIFEGRTTTEIRSELPNWSIWQTAVEKGETIDAIAARANRVIEKVFNVEGDVALFSHGHLLRILAARWLGLPPKDGRFLALDTASISILGFERETRVIRGWNRQVG